MSQEPALTPEQWARRRVEFPEPTSIYSNEWDVAIQKRDDGTVVWEYVSEGCDRSIPLEPAHAVAALSLFGQPFGFTREDVKALLYTLDDAGKCGTDDILQSIAERIAALLPPEP
jgi:hypothetical protein